MTCSNIIIFTQVDPEDDPETNSVKDLLKERYQATRKIHEIQFDIFDDPPKFLTITGDGRPKENHSDTGIYVIVHGAQNTGMLSPLLGTERANRFAQWLFSLTEHGFQIRKICFITCLGMAVDKQADIKTARPIPDRDEANIYVQNICHAIRKLGNLERLNGLMIAGYSSGVYLHKSVPEKQDQPERRPGYKLTQKDKTAHVMHPNPKVGKDLTKKLKSYVQNKMVFVLQDGIWRLGSVWEYTDNAELKSALEKRKV
jgi:hypothetical protein